MAAVPHHKMGGRGKQAMAAVASGGHQNTGDLTGGDARYGLSRPVARKEVKNFYNDLQAGKLNNPDITAEWRRQTRNRLTGPIGDTFRFPVAGRLNAKESMLSADGTIAAGTGIKSNAATDFQRLYRFWHKVNFDRTLFMGVETDEVEATFFISKMGFKRDGRHHMSNLLDRRIFSIQACAPSQFVPNVSSAYLNDPGVASVQDSSLHGVPAADQIDGSLSSSRFRELNMRFKSQGVMESRSKPYLFMGYRAYAELADQVAKLEGDIDRSLVTKVMMNDYQGDLGGIRLATSVNLPTHTCGNFEANAAISTDWSTGGLRVKGAATGPLGGMTEAQFSEKTGDDQLDEWTVKVDGFLARTAAQVGTSGRVLFRKGDVIRNYGRRKVGADSGIFYEINQASREPLEYHGQWTVLEDVVAPASTAIAADTGFDLKLGWQGVDGGPWRSIKRLFKDGDLILPVSGRPGEEYRQAIGWQRQGLALIFQNPFANLDGQKAMPSTETKVAGRLQGANNAVIAMSATSSFHDQTVLFREDVWYACRSIHGWYNNGRIMLGNA